MPDDLVEEEADNLAKKLEAFTEICDEVQSVGINIRQSKVRKPTVHFFLIFELDFFIKLNQ